MKRDTLEWLRSFGKIRTSSDFSRRGAADALATDAENKALRRSMRKLQELIVDRCECDPDKKSRCAPHEFILAALKRPSRRKGER